MPTSSRRHPSGRLSALRAGCFAFAAARRRPAGGPRDAGAGALRRALRVPDVHQGGGARGPVGRMRRPGPGRVHLGRNRRRPLPLRRPPVSRSSGTTRGCRACASIRSTRRPAESSMSRPAAGLAAVPGRPLRRSRREGRARNLRHQAPGPRVGRSGDPLRRNGPRSLLRQGRPLPVRQGGQLARLGRGDRRARGRQRCALLLPRRPALPQGVGAGRRVRPAAGTPVRRDAGRGADRRRGSPVGAHGQAPLSSSRRGAQHFERDDEGLPESSEVGRLASRRPRRDARADGAGPRVPGCERRGA